MSIIYRIDVNYHRAEFVATKSNRIEGVQVRQGITWQVAYDGKTYTMVVASVGVLVFAHRKTVVARIFQNGKPGDACFVRLKCVSDAGANLQPPVAKSKRYFVSMSVFFILLFVVITCVFRRKYPTAITMPQPRCDKTQFLPPCGVAVVSGYG